MKSEVANITSGESVTVISHERVRSGVKEGEKGRRRRREKGGV